MMAVDSENPAVAVVCALVSGACFAGGGVLQQHEARSRPDAEALSFRLLVGLAHDPLWLLGIGLAVVSYVIEAIALRFGPLVLVQPLIVTELLFALPISIRWRGQSMSIREWLGTASVAVGLAVGIASAAPRAGRPEAPIAEWITALSVLAGIALVAVLVGRSRAGSVRSSSYAAAGGVVLGIQAALLKAAIPRFEHSLTAALTGWQVWAMLVAGILALLLVQSAYEAGPLATSMPVVDAVEPSVAIVFGIALFNEHIRTGVWLAGITAGLLLLLVGIVILDTSPLIQSLQQSQRQVDREPSGSGG